MKPGADPSRWIIAWWEHTGALVLRFCMDAVSPALRYVQFRVVEPSTHSFGVFEMRFQHTRFNVWCFLFVFYPGITTRITVASKFRG